MLVSLDISKVYSPPLDSGEDGAACNSRCVCLLGDSGALVHVQISNDAVYVVIAAHGSRHRVRSLDRGSGGLISSMPRVGRETVLQLAKEMQ